MKKFDVKKLTILGALTAIVFVLQSFIRIPVGVIFSLSVVLVPIVIGGVLYGVWAGAWLGLVFAIAVFISGDATFYFGLNVFGTLVTVIVKGILAGAGSAALFKILQKKNYLLAVLSASIACPVINTGMFILLSKLFFYQNESLFSIIAMVVGINFVIELAVNIILNPTILMLIKYVKSRH